MNNTRSDSVLNTVARFNAVKIPGILLIVSSLTYGILIPRLGLYSDDFLKIWIVSQYGPGAVLFHFVYNRPLIGLLVMTVTRILGYQPLGYHLLHVLMQWGTALVVYQLIKTIWPAKQNFAFICALLFLVYPGYSMWPIAMTTSVEFLLMISLELLSILFCILALKNPKRWLLYQSIGVMFCAINLFSTEYFFFLELARPIFLYLFLMQSGEVKRVLTARRVFLASTPYLLLIVSALIWRLKYFPNQNNAYHFSTLEQFQLSFLDGCVYVLKMVIQDLYTVFVQAWLKVFNFSSDPVGRRYLLISVVLSVVAAGLFWWFARKSSLQDDCNMTWRGWFAILILGIACLFLGGPSIWAVDLHPVIDSHLSRLTLPFVLGVSILLAAALFRLPGKLRVGLLSILIALSVGSHFRVGVTYMLDWQKQNELFWQVTWRVPALQDDSVILSNELPFLAKSTSFSAAWVNWVYAPAAIGEFPQARLNWISAQTQFVETNGSFEYRPWVNTWSLSFQPENDRIIAVSYPSRCLVMLNPKMDAINPNLDAYLQAAAAISNPDVVLNGDLKPDTAFLAGLFGEEPEHDWCYFFEKADLAVQRGQWDEALTATVEALETFEIRETTVRYLVPFIQTYLHAGMSDEALELTSKGLDANPAAREMLCLVWQQAGTDNPALEIPVSCEQAATGD